MLREIAACSPGRARGAEPETFPTDRLKEESAAITFPEHWTYDPPGLVSAAYSVKQERVRTREFAIVDSVCSPTHQHPV